MARWLRWRKVQASHLKFEWQSGYESWLEYEMLLALTKEYLWKLESGMEWK